MGSRSRLEAALFGIKSGQVWVADNAIVTRRQDGDILVEGWVGRRTASILVPKNSNGTTRAIWDKLNEIAKDDLTASAGRATARKSPPDTRHSGRR